MTYEGSAHRTPEEQAIVAASLRREYAKNAARAKERRRKLVRDLIEDAIVLVIVLLIGVVAGVRIERVYIHEHKPADPHAVETSGHNVP